MEQLVTSAPIQLPAPPPPTEIDCPGCGKKLKVRAELAGKKVKCPKCGNVVPVPLPETRIQTEPDEATYVEVEPDEATYVEVEPDEPRRSIFSLLMTIAAVFVIVVTVIGCSVWANLSFTVTKGVNYKYFPPFRPHHNANWNRHLGAEYHEIAKSIVAGEGFSSPFKEKTGPTAWMPPILPYLTAALLLICDNDRDAVMAVIIFFQVCTIIFTGLIALFLAKQTTNHVWTIVIAAGFLVGLMCDFHMWFQVTHDPWFVLLGLNLVVAGFAWCKPMQGWKSSVAWGLLGGISAMISPIVGLSWGAATFVLLVQHRSWIRFGIMCVLAALTLTPWCVRNYLVFGRFIPVKSNASYEFWQSQVLTPDGLLQPNAFGSHPYGNPGRERSLYKQMGEMEFLDKKRELFRESVKKDPVEFLDRVACRFLGATLWYIPFNRGDVRDRPWVVWTNRVLHPLPFLGLLLLAATAVWRPLHAVQWGVMGVYVLYLSPYIAISYYERYAVPLLGVKVLLAIWALDRLLSMLIWLATWLIGLVRSKF